MAIATTPKAQYPDWKDIFLPEAEQNVYDTAIGGKLIEIRYKINNESLEQLNIIGDTEWRKHIRESLAMQLAKVLMENHVEFTTLKDPSTFDQYVFARCYLAPNDQVKLIRMKMQQDEQGRN